MDNKYITVGLLTNYIKEILEKDIHLNKVYMKGEISQITVQQTGHVYMVIKDENSQINATMWASSAKSYAIEDFKQGDQVLVEGKINVYVPHGRYNLLINKISRDGIGKLHDEYKKRIKYYQDLGWFDLRHKKEIPSFPTIIGVITSPTGAVIQDIRTTTANRSLIPKVVLYKTVVQGNDAAVDIANSIIKANNEDINNRPDLLIVGRGGGSFEDLFCFNDPLVIEAIFGSSIPIITAIGHETDTAIADYVADLRVATPTAAAVAAIKRTTSDLLNDLYQYQVDLTNKLQSIIDAKKIDLLRIEKSIIMLNPLMLLENQIDSIKKIRLNLKNQIDNLFERKGYLLETLRLKLNSPLNQIILFDQSITNIEVILKNSINTLMKAKENTLKEVLLKLNALDRLQLLNKGYSILISNNKVITSINDVGINTNIDVILKDGTINANIVSLNKKTEK